MKGFLGLGYTTLIRVFMPGCIFTAALSPLLYLIAQWVARLTTFGGLKPGSFGDAVVFFVITSALAGGMLILLDDYIYRLFEGIWFFPSFVKKWGTELLKWQLKRRRGALKRLTREDPRYDKLRRKVWDFTMNEQGEPEVKFPTLLGNIIREYEDYPWSRYRVVSPFYWYRLRLAVEEEKKKEMDQQSAEADSMLYSSFAISFASFMYLCLWLSSIWLPPRFLISIFGIGFFSSWGFLYPIGGFVLAYGTYRASLPIHRRNGEYYKSLFDTYGCILNGWIQGAPIVNLDMNLWNNLERRYWYLRRLLVKCEECNNEFTPPQPPCNLSCPHCGKYPFKS